MKTIKIKGKPYVMVHERIVEFRSKYPEWSLITELIENENGVCIFKASIIDDKGITRATGYAYEKEGSTFINKTSYIENAETSAWGRCLACLGIGILDTGIASAEEVGNAITQQDNPQPNKNETPNKETQFEYLRDNTRKIATGMFKNVKYDNYRKLITEIGKGVGTAENIGFLKRNELQLNIISLMTRIDGELEDSQIEHYQNRISKAKMDELKTIKVEFEKLFKAMETDE